MKALALALACLLNLTALAQTPVPPQTFGMHYHRLTDPWPVIAFNTFRFWDTGGTRWGATNVAPGTYKFGPLDNMLTALGTHGVADAMFNLGGGTPQWVSSNPVDTDCDYAGYNGENGYCDPPSDLNADGTGTNLTWRAWVAAVSSHIMTSSSGVRVVAYEIWNEFTRQPNFPGVAHFAWKGTNEQMVRLAQDARCIITGRGTIIATGETCAQVLRTISLGAPTDPRALILSPSFGLANEVGNQNWQAYFATPGAGDAAEGFALHQYVPLPENNYSATMKFRDGLNASDKLKPMWSTEGSWGHADRLVDLDLRAGFVARYYLLNWSVGFARVYWYAYDDSETGTLWTPTGGLEKSGQAYTEVYDWMVGATMSQPCAATGTVWTCGLTGANGGSMRAVWDTSQSCSGGVCTTSLYRNVTGYHTYRTVDGGRAPVDGDSVPKMTLPILLLESPHPPTDLNATVN